MLRHVRLGTLVALFLSVWTAAAAASPFAYITNSGSGNISVIDLASNAEVDLIALPGAGLPWGVALAPDGKVLYATNFGNGTLYKIDLATKAVQQFTTPSGAFGVAVHPSGSHVYVTHNSFAGGMSIFDTATFTRTPALFGRLSAGVAANAAKGHLYVANMSGLAVFDLATNGFVRSVSLGGRTFGVAVHPQGTTIYATLPGTGQLAVIDATTFTFTLVSLPGAATPQGVAVSPDGKRVCVSNYDSRNVSVVDAMTNTFLTNVTVGSNPYGIQVTPDGSRVYVANWGSHNVSVINTTNLGVTTVALGGRAPVAFGLFMPPGLSVITVGIDIMPGGHPNAINLRAQGTLPVAILGSAEFNVADVDPTSVRLAGAGVVIKKNGEPMASVDDVNGDGFMDLVVHVARSDLQVNAGDTEAMLEGKTYDGKTFQGKDSVKIIQ